MVGNIATSDKYDSYHDVKIAIYSNQEGNSIKNTSGHFLQDSFVKPV